MTSSFAPLPFPKADMKAGESVSGNTPLTGNPSSGLSVVDGILDIMIRLIVEWRIMIMICIRDS